MTAINILLQREAGHLVTDAAWYDLDGVVQHFGPKSHALAHWPGAIATRGPGLANALIAAEAGMTFPDFDSFADGAGDFLAAWCEREAAHLASWESQGHVEMIAVGWSHRLDRLRAFIVGSKDEGAEAAALGRAIGEDEHAVQPFELFEIEAGYVRPQPAPDALADYGVDPSADFDAMPAAAFGAYAMGIVCAQREQREPLLPGGDPVCFVGGYIMHTIVTRTNVGTMKTAVFPDVAGQRIAAQRFDVQSLTGEKAAPTPPPGLTRQQRRAWEAGQRRASAGRVRVV